MANKRDFISKIQEFVHSQLVSLYIQLVSCWTVFIETLMLLCTLSGVTLCCSEWFGGRHGSSMGHVDGHVYTQARGTQFSSDGADMHRDVCG